MNTYLLWENEDFQITTPKNPHQKYSEGLHVIVAPKTEIAAAWSDAELAARAFKLAAETCKILEEQRFGPWFNLQANGNWGLLPGNTPFFHIHIYGRNRTETWGKPIILPTAPGTYQNEPLPETDRSILTQVFSLLSP